MRSNLASGKRHFKSSSHFSLYGKAVYVSYFHTDKLCVSVGDFAALVTGILCKSVEFSRRLAQILDLIRTYCRIDLTAANVNFRNVPPYSLVDKNLEVLPTIWYLSTLQKAQRVIFALTYRISERLRLLLTVSVILRWYFC